MEISKTVKIRTRTYKFSAKDLKLLEIIANHMREEQGYYLQQMERYHINFHDLKRVAHIGPELYERFLYSIVSEHRGGLERKGKYASKGSSGERIS